MGKVERLRQERRLLELQHKQVKSETAYRNTIFLYGFITGVVITAIVSFSIAKSVSRPVPSTTNLPKLENGAVPLASPISLPSNVNLNGGTPLPLSQP